MKIFWGVQNGEKKLDTVMEGSLRTGKFNLDFRNFIYHKEWQRAMLQIAQKFQAKCKSPKEIT
jgi:hypothetical protein